MQRLWASLGSIVFLVLAPGTVAGLVPWWIADWRLGSDDFLHRGMGTALIALGLAPLLASFARFAWQGLGTPAPVAPPQHLVVTGCYRHVRNPMYVAVATPLIGEALLFASVGIFAFALIFLIATHLFVIFYEEPTLREKFGDRYMNYRAHVPRWWPLVTPWQGGG
ncbi:methyltransferase family protein [Methylovirgula sp. 4M-Z18]|uniref:methyltransferase family protein n=1 Tax=Methylovirgula sp. 4M-Z18 TaxID=2293567 RepID=UPI000E2FB2E9|nr:isoprenylcysteine carboxylmethyltransferase family protein [Methylovirgula sp. 4M-Z18]RFB81449.1 isoprenylcysteine carboxylmethyltransferase family protein [Methylovirgula sp. 4M-Z18]